jgi:hypothetical protein
MASGIAPPTYAVLVGIDDYGIPKLNLFGCVNDVKLMLRTLETDFGVPSDNITTLTAPLPSTLGASMSSCRAPLKPTKLNFIQAIQDAASKAISASSPAAPSTLVVHYSGHGDRLPTIYPQIKSPVGQDEVLCTLEGDVTDLEFAELIQNAAVDKGLTCVVILDCCHSGGADRHGSSPESTTEIGSPRCRSHQARPSDHASASSASSRGYRDVSIRDTWFYRERGYNLIAACQPHELASEWTRKSRAADGSTVSTTYGALTWHFVKSLTVLRPSPSAVTYSMLESTLSALMSESKLRQQPLHLGEKKRLLLRHTESGSVHPEAARGKIMRASITAVQFGVVTLDKGASHGVGSGDRFAVYKPSSFQFGIKLKGIKPTGEVEVRTVGGLSSVGVVVGSPSESMGTGWFLELIKPAKPFDVNFEADGEGKATEILRRFNTKVLEFLHENGKGEFIDIRLPGEEHKTPTLTVKLANNDDSFQFHDRHGAALPHLPPVTADDPAAPAKLAYIVTHLSYYLRILHLGTPTSSSWSPPYTFTVTEIPPIDPLYFSGQRIEFENNHSAPLYLTILALSPLYGVTQLHPPQNGSSGAIDEHRSLSPPLELDIGPPERLRRESLEPGFEMKDVIMAIVSEELGGFGEVYELEDVMRWEDWDNAMKVDERAEHFAALRHSTPRPRGPKGRWCVARAEIVSRR